MSAKEFYREKRPYTPDIPPEVWQKIIRHATVVSGVLSPELPPTFGATSSDRNQLREFRKSLVWPILHYLAVFAQLFVDHEAQPRTSQQGMVHSCVALPL